MAVPEILEIIDYNGYGVTFSGGDPFYQAEALLPLAAAIKERGLSLWAYTGFTLDELLGAGAPAGASALLEYVDVLVDGPFIAAERDITLLFRGSANQRLIDLAATRSAKNQGPVLWSPDF